MFLCFHVWVLRFGVLGFRLQLPAAPFLKSSQPFLLLKEKEGLAEFLFLAPWVCVWAVPVQLGRGGITTKL